MGTHPIFESDFDCLTEGMASEKALRVGIKSRPPTLVVVYQTEKGEKGHKRLRKIPLKDISGESASGVMSRLLSRPSHSSLLRSINEEKLLSILSRAPGVLSDPVPEPVPEVSSPIPSPPPETNNSETDKKSAESASEIESEIESQVDESETHNSYNSSRSSLVDTADEKSASQSQATSQKSQKSEQNDYLDNLLKAKSRNLSFLDSTASQVSESGKDLSDTDNASLSENTFSDLNHLSDAGLEKAKSKMDVNFLANQVKPSDGDFEYDKRADFEPTETCGWDLDSDESF